MMFRKIFVTRFSPNHAHIPFLFCTFAPASYVTSDGWSHQDTIGHR